MRRFCFIISMLLLLSSYALAEIVVTRDTVRNFVNIRQFADSDSDSIGQLRLGDRVPHARSVTGWHVITMPSGTDGFVPKRWTEVLPDPIDLSQNVVVHFLDVGTGDSAIIDMGDREIIIDGGDSIAVLNRYA
ncbi:MAG: hypothetical protein IIA11_00520 [Proteobacteria bacterium]|nr:hypothetical protein [Pseudomonadota bacterium]